MNEWLEQKDLIIETSICFSEDAQKTTKRTEGVNCGTLRWLSQHVKDDCRTNLEPYFNRCIYIKWKERTDSRTLSSHQQSPTNRRHPASKTD